MPLFPARPRPTTPPASAAARPESRSFRFLWPFLLAVLLLVGAILSLPACEREPDKTPGTTKVEPGDIFRQRAPQPQARSASRRLLVIGDSLSISLGEQLERALAGVPGLDFTRDGTRSTGLTRPDLLNWPEHLRELVDKAAPDIVVIMIGANDVMPVQTPDGGHVYFEDPAWPKAYAAKARELVAICRQANPRVAIYWVGVPTMGEASLASGVQKVNAALRAMCPAAGCRYIDTQAPFSDPSDQFARHAKDAATGDIVSLRTSDAVHLTENGARLLAGTVLKTLVAQEHLPPAAGINELLARAQDLQAVADSDPPEPKPAPQPMPRGPVHTVRQGDTLALIAKRHRTTEEKLQALNPGVDSRRLSIGQKVRLPRR